MTATILRLLKKPIKPLPDPRLDRAYQTAVGTAIQLGDRVREFQEWKDDFAIRKGRAA